MSHTRSAMPKFKHYDYRTEPICGQNGPEYVSGFCSLERDHTTDHEAQQPGVWFAQWPTGKMACGHPIGAPCMGYHGDRGSMVARKDPGCGLGECQRAGWHVPSCPLWRKDKKAERELSGRADVM
jgi:hypothetical protein